MGQWHIIVQVAIDNLLTLFALVIGLVALIHCALQRADAFPAIGTLQKPAWLAILGIATFLVLCVALPTAGGGATPFSLMFKLVAIGAAALYLLDVRPGIRDISNGRW